MARQTKTVPENESAADYLPARGDLRSLKLAAKHCEGCPLHLRATQTVFGDGKASARLMLVGEQPGDAEDRAGKPFVGPAGALLTNTLEEAGIDRQDVYLTNAVKHFKWVERGSRRLHSKPSAREVKACRPWLIAEVQAIEPAIVVCLGATAAQSLLGASFRVTRERGKWLKSEHAPWMMATWHPSAILRAPDEAAREAMRQEFLRDLRQAMRKLAKR